MPQLAVTLFGALCTTVDENPITRFRSVKNQALFAYLAVEADRPHARTTLAGLLWPDDSEATARQNLRQALFQLRTILNPPGNGPDWLMVTPTTVQFNPAGDCRLDVATFKRLHSACERHEHAAIHTCVPCMRRLAEAIDLYNGSFLEGLFLDGSPGMEQWIVLRRDAYHHQALHALYLLADWHQSQGDTAAAYRCAQRQIELDPLREEAYRQAMVALASDGQASEALSLYLTCSQRLYTELGVSPSPATEALFQQISNASLPVGSRQNDTHAAVQTPTRPRHNLPAAVNAFIGREVELARIAASLQDPTCRLLTLVGFGGVGKTRLALQAAGKLVDAYADGVWFVPLAGIEDGGDLAAAIITALGLTPPKGDAAEFVLTYLASRELLLVLDNFEHLTSAGAFVADLLSRAGGVKVVVTSRERLNLQAETPLLVSPLPVPTAAADLAGFSCIKLFAERAARSLLGFTLDDETLPAVAAICRAVDGLPLGIELAATWVDQFTCAEIAAAIMRSHDFLSTTQGDVPPRQRSLRAVFDHSWRLLSAAEQQTLANSAVFHGAFGRNAALEVARTTVPTLASLTHKSLLRPAASGRYILHEVVRQFAAEHLQAAYDPVAGHRRHSHYYLQFVAGWEGMLWSHENNQACSQILLEIDNVRAAWRWAAQHEMAATLLASLKALVRFYTMAGLYREAATLLQQAVDPLPTLALGGDALAAAPNAQAAAASLLTLRARLLVEQSRMLHHLSDYPAGAAAAAEALAIAESLTDRQLQSAALRALADARYQQGERSEAQQTMADALRLAQSSGSVELEADCQLGYADMLMYLGDSQAETAHDRALELYRQFGDRCGEAWTFNSMGIAAAFQKRYGPGQAHFESAAAIFQELGDRPSTGRVLNNLAAIHVLQKHYATAEPILLQSLTLSRQNGYRLGEVQTLTNLTEALRGLGKREAARTYCVEALDLARTLGHVRGEGMQLKILGEMAVEDGDYAAALEFFSQSLAAARAQGDRYYEGERLFCLGQVYRFLSDTDLARQHLLESLATAQRVSDEATAAKAEAELDLLGTG